MDLRTELGFVLAGSTEYIPGVDWEGYALHFLDGLKIFLFLHMSQSSSPLCVGLWSLLSALAFFS